MLQPTDCIASDFNSQWYKKWARLIGFPAAKHPKFWEIAAIAEALYSRKCLRSGKKGLGMGVGNEQLVSIFAGMGVKITATDQDPNSDNAQKWNNGQLAYSKDTLFYEHIVSREKYDQNTRYQPYDMNTDNPEFVDSFDFIWHNCVIGHLGSLDNARAQLKRSANYLRKGGWLVFTSELNLSSFEVTIDKGSDTVVWRLKDLEDLFVQMAEVGLVADRFKVRLGTHEFDTRINYNHNNNVYQSTEIALSNPHLSEIKIPFAGHAITQILLCFKKTGKQPRKLFDKYAKDTHDNTLAIMKHTLKNKDLRDYHETPDPIHYQDAHLMPERKEISITMRAGETAKLNLRYLNRSHFRLFDFSLNKPFNRPPLVVATYDPVNRPSRFATPDWSSNNRPKLQFAVQRTSSSPAWNAHRVDPAQWFEYTFPLKAPAKPGVYTENFVLVFEGTAIVTSSIVSVTITVPKDKKLSRHHPPKNTISIQKFLKIIGWYTRNRDRPEIPQQFSAWLKNLAAEQFRSRLYMRPYECLAFFRAYLRSINEELLIPDKALQTILPHQFAYVELRRPALIASLRSRLILVASTPRVGGTVISQALSEITGWPRYAVSNLRLIDFNDLNGTTIIHLHATKDEIREFQFPLPYQVVTIARNPLDTLVSAFKFVQKNPSCVYWLEGKVFAKPVRYHDKNPDSPEFAAWALSEQSKTMLSVTPSWWDSADSRLSYELFRQNPAEALRATLQTIDPERHHSAGKIAAIAHEIDRSFLKQTENQHRWHGGSNYAETLIPSETLKAVKAFHRETIQKLGY